MEATEEDILLVRPKVCAQPTRVVILRRKPARYAARIGTTTQRFLSGHQLSWGSWEMQGPNSSAKGPSRALRRPQDPEALVGPPFLPGVASICRCRQQGALAAWLSSLGHAKTGQRRQSGRPTISSSSPFWHSRKVGEDGAAEAGGIRFGRDSVVRTTERTPGGMPHPCVAGTPNSGCPPRSACLQDTGDVRAQRTSLQSRPG